MSSFVPGQRWISNAEPELGLGTVVRLDGRRVQILFARAGVLRHYAMNSAPLVRAEFRVDQTLSADGEVLKVQRVSEHDGLLVYHGLDNAGEPGTLGEAELDDTQSFSRADEKLMAGRADPPQRFELRLEAFEHRARARRSPAWGLASARVELLPHQLGIVTAAGEQRTPRVLLADEVGLGKTIEAGMLLAHQIAHGRARRVLILVPESLLHQWFVELLRRFNLAFAIFDEERCEAIETAGDTRNPFADEQLVLAAISLPLSDERRRRQLIDAGWDMLIVDEAHHLTWTPQHASAAYALVEHIAAATPSLVLLTATPEQLGRSGHFARLRLLDPARYSELDEFVRESDGYIQLSRIAGNLAGDEPLDDDMRRQLHDHYAGDAALQELVDAYGTDDGQANPEHAGRLLDALIDRHGTGRVMFRNRRDNVGGFARRCPDLTIAEDIALDDDRRQHLLAEFISDIQDPPSPLQLEYSDDPRLDWLIDLLETHLDQRFLLICRSQAKVLALEQALRTRTGIPLARFHESQSLLQRDRNAAWFAEADGAQILLCSEIGSEGRNFQFAHHLVLWDLPLDPDLLEQRIGRLDRIGQRNDIHLHAIAFPGTAQHVLLRWHHEGVDALHASPADGRELKRRFGDLLSERAIAHARGDMQNNQEIDALIAETQAVHRELSERVHAGRDRLLELAAARSARHDTLREALLEADTDVQSNHFMVRTMEHLGVQVEDLGGALLRLTAQPDVAAGFGKLEDTPQLATFDRATALMREDVALLRLDHPLAGVALDILSEGETGNTAFIVDAGLPARTAVLQCVFVLECVADATLDVERFLAPTPIVRSIDSRRRERPGFSPSDEAIGRARERPLDAGRYRKFLQQLIPPMLAAAQPLAEHASEMLRAHAREQAQAAFTTEIERLAALAAVNESVHTRDVEQLRKESDAVDQALRQSRLRLDALRLVVSADFLSLR